MSVQIQGSHPVIHYIISKLQTFGTHRGNTRKAFYRQMGALTPRVSAKHLKHVSTAESICCYFSLGFSTYQKAHGYTVMTRHSLLMLD